MYWGPEKSIQRISQLARSDAVSSVEWGNPVSPKKPETKWLYLTSLTSEFGERQNPQSIQPIYASWSYTRKPKFHRATRLNTSESLHLHPYSRRHPRPIPANKYHKEKKVLIKHEAQTNPTLLCVLSKSIQLKFPHQRLIRRIDHHHQIAKQSEPTLPITKLSLSLLREKQSPSRDSFAQRISP